MHSSALLYQSPSLPSNVEELAAGGKLGFSSTRYKDLSQGVAQSQTASVFGASFMSNQMSQCTEGIHWMFYSIYNL